MINGIDKMILQAGHTADLKQQRAQYVAIINELNTRLESAIANHSMTAAELDRARTRIEKLQDKLEQYKTNDKVLRTQIEGLSNRLLAIGNENNQMLPWASEMLLSIRDRYTKQIGNGRPVTELDLETRRNINRHILAAGFTLYEGLVVAHALLKKYTPVNSRLSNVLELYKQNEHDAKPENRARAQKAETILESEWKALPEASSYIEEAERMLITSKTSGDDFRKKLSANFGALSSRIDGAPSSAPELAPKDGSARYEWVGGQPHPKNPYLHDMLAEDFLGISSKQLP